jgi:pimeloyl-ACP methyl ester carboxylesterase
MKGFNNLIITLVFTLSVVFSVVSQAQIQEGHIEISDSRAVAYNYVPAKAGKPTIVLLNGLIYSLKNWEAYVNLLADDGYGVVLVAYSTQPESLRKTKSTPYFSKITTTINGPAQVGLEVKDLADDVMQVVDHLKIDQFHLQTLSFGSIVGSYIANNFKSRTQTVSLISPAVMSSHRYTPYGDSRHKFYVWQNQININPFYVPDYYYDLELLQTMSLMLITQYKTYDLDGIKYKHFFNGVYQMARASKYFDLKDESDKDWSTTYLILASGEDASLRRDQMNYWNEKRVAAKDSRLIEVEGAPHAIPGTHPAGIFKITDAILKGELNPGEFKFYTQGNQWTEPVADSSAMCEAFLSDWASSARATTGLSFDTFGLSH